MFTITKIMLYSAIPLFSFFGYRAVKHLRVGKYTTKNKASALSMYVIFYLIVGLILFVTTFFDTNFGRVFFDFYWLSAITLGLFFCIKEFNNNPFYALVLLFFSYIYILFLPYIAMFTYM